MFTYYDAIWRTVLARQIPRATVCDVLSDATDLTTYTFTAANIGDFGSSLLDTSTPLSQNTIQAPSNKLLVICVHAEDALTTFGVNSVTVGGVSGTEVIDRGGGTQAINTAIYVFNPSTLDAITTTDVVVTMSEAVTGCAIGIISIDNVCSVSRLAHHPGSSGSGVLDITLSTLDDTRVKRYCCAIFATTCVTGGGTEHAIFDPVGTGVAPPTTQTQFLYEGNNAEFDFAACFCICMQDIPGSETSLEMYCSWSGTGQGDAIGAAFQ